MKTNYILLVLSLTFFQLNAQKNSAQIGINSGLSITTGDYSTLTFDENSIDLIQYPFSNGLGAQNGFSIGISNSYFFSKNIGVSLDWNYAVHDIITGPRANYFKNAFGDYYSDYKAQNVKGWSHNTLNLGAHIAFPFANDKFAIDLKSLIGFSSFSTPSITESIYQFGDSQDSELTYSLRQDNFISLSTKFELGFKYFIKNFGIGLYVNALTVYNAESINYANVDIEYLDFNTGDYQKFDSKYWIQFNSDMINYGLNLTYRIQKK